MKSYGPFIIFQIARFGALTVPQLLSLSRGKCCRSSLYRLLNELLEYRLIESIRNPTSRTVAYVPTLAGRKYVYGDDHCFTSGVKIAELDHAVNCSSVLINLCRYENISGIATQYELDQKSFRGAIHERLPDGIAQVTRGTDKYEIAVEVECSLRNINRVDDVLDKYFKTFDRGMKCAGALIVVMAKQIQTRYLTALSKRPEAFQKRVRICFGPGLDGINTEIFGNPIKDPLSTLDLCRTEFNGEPEYMAGKSKVFSVPEALAVPTLKGVGPQTNLKEIK